MLMANETKIGRRTAEITALNGAAISAAKRSFVVRLFNAGLIKPQIRLPRAVSRSISVHISTNSVHFTKPPSFDYCNKCKFGNEMFLTSNSKNSGLKRGNSFTVTRSLLLP